MIDLKRLRDIALDLMEIPDMADDFRYFVESFAVMLSDDPLTLDAAKAVMGREPDQSSLCGTGIGWHEEDVSVWTLSNGTVGAMAYDKEVINPTVGQFACLVLAAKQGETT